jgi:hypothetical protein
MKGRSNSCLHLQKERRLPNMAMKRYGIKDEVTASWNCRVLWGKQGTVSKSSGAACGLAKSNNFI